MLYLLLGAKLVVVEDLKDSGIIQLIDHLESLDGFETQVDIFHISAEEFRFGG